MSKTSNQHSRSIAASVRQRLIAAHRLAAGDPPSLAAAMASLETLQVAELHADNDDMGHLVAACAGVQRLDHDSWLRRLAEQVRVSVELAVVDGNTTTVMGTSRALAILRPVAFGPYDGPDGELQRFIDAMSEQDYTDYVALGYQDVTDPDTQEPPTTGESATILPFRHPDVPPDEPT